MTPQTVEGTLRAEGFRFAIVVSRFNDFVTNRLLAGALDALERLGAGQENVRVYKVPGSFEIPQLARRLATSGRWDAVLCLGALIKGETSHFDFLAAEVTKGAASVAMETGVPVAFGILTANTLEEAIERAGAKMGNKGFEAAMTAVEMVNLYRQLE
jgi:6,7-dimethyl-8-ribityllumazine synthase